MEGSPEAAVQNTQYLYTEDQRPSRPPSVFATAVFHNHRRVWPEDEPGINAKFGWQISHWWGLWGPNRMDKWATDQKDQSNPVSARVGSTAQGTSTAGLERTRPVPHSLEGVLPTPSRNRR